MIVILEFPDKTKQSFDIPSLCIQTPNRKVRISTHDEFIKITNIHNEFNKASNKPLSVFKESFTVNIL